VCLGEPAELAVDGHELSEHLGYPAGQAPPGGAGNSRNGCTPKTLLTDHGRVRIDTPRDRNSHFEPQRVKKGQRRLAGLQEKIIALYAGGMTTREIETYISELYGPGVSRETVSRVTAAVLEDAKAWQTRPLEQVYPILYLDALVIKIRDGQAIRNSSPGLRTAGMPERGYPQGRGETREGTVVRSRPRGTTLVRGGESPETLSWSGER
jgi:transposase-like protein